MGSGFRRYAELLDRLFWLRALDELTEDTEEALAVALHDCRATMTPEEESKIDELVASRRAIRAEPTLRFKDTAPDDSLGPPREAA
jgi:hypothetical protein